MLNSQGREYSGLDIRVQDIPERSELYSLEPVGLETPYVEGLSSYICRLAEMHCIEVKRFMKMIIFPNMDKLTSMRKTVHPNFYTHYLRSEEGAIWMTHEMAKALEKLTLQNDLTSLTTSKWRYVIGRNHLHKSHFTWCPLCFDEWKKKCNAPHCQDTF